MKALSGKEFCKVLERHGWELKRTSSSHFHYGKHGHREIISVPVHRNVSLKIGLQRHCMKIADLEEDDLE